MGIYAQACARRMKQLCQFKGTSKFVLVYIFRAQCLCYIGTKLKLERKRKVLYEKAAMLECAVETQIVFQLQRYGKQNDVISVWIMVLHIWDNLHFSCDHTVTVYRQMQSILWEQDVWFNSSLSKLLRQFFLCHCLDYESASIRNLVLSSTNIPLARDELLCQL